MAGWSIVYSAAVADRIPNVLIQNKTAGTSCPTVLCDWLRDLFFDPVAMQIVAVNIEPLLGALGLRTDTRNDLPEPRRVVHLDQMRDLMSGEIVEHIRWREDQPP